MRRQLAITGLLGAVLLSGCASDGTHDAGPAPSRATVPATVVTTLAPVSSTVPPATTTTSRSPRSTAVPTPTTPSDDRLGPSSKLRVDGLGPVRVGMTLDQARAAAGIPLDLTSTEHCRSLTPADRRVPATFIATAGEAIDAITVFGGAIVTDAGVRIGSSEENVLSAYRGAQVLNPGEPFHRIVYRSPDAALRSFALVFGIGDGQVAAMAAGTDAVLADELCS